MYATRRRGFPFAGLPIFAAGFILASLIGSAGTAVAFLLFLPLLALKFMFMFFLFGALLRFAGGGFARMGPRNSWSHQRYESTRREPTQEERDWARAREQARREIDDLFPDTTD
jgi:hypothetical protein